jgi:TonB family protein
VKIAEGMLRRLGQSTPMPVYPEELLAQRIEGPVVASILTTPEGSTEQVTILQAPHLAMDRAVRDALKHWRFEPVKVRDSQDRWHIKGTLTFYFGVINGQGVVANPSELPDAATHSTQASTTPARIAGPR